MLIPLLMISTNILPSDLWKVVAVALGLLFVCLRLHDVLSLARVLSSLCIAIVLSTLVHYRRYPISKYCKSMGAVWGPCYHLLRSNLMAFSEHWHGFEIHGEDIAVDNDRASKIVLVGVHSRCALDSLYLCAHTEAAVAQPPVLWRVPGVSALVSWYRGEQAPCHQCTAEHHDLPAAEREVLHFIEHRSGRVAALWPGGYAEAYAERSWRPHVRWDAEPAFARALSRLDISTLNSVCIVPFYTRNGDSLFFNPPWWSSGTGALVRKHIREQAGGGGAIARIKLAILCILGLGFFLLPRPVKIDTYFGGPVFLREGESAAALAARAASSLQLLVDKCDALPKQRLHSKAGLLPVLFTGVYGLYIMVQNIVIFGALVSLSVIIQVFNACTLKATPADNVEKDK